MVAHEFRNALARNGIESVPTVGHTFDPAVHEALSQVDSPDHAPGTVTFTSERVARDLRTSLVAKLATQDVAYIQRTTTATLLTDAILEFVHSVK